MRFGPTVDLMGERWLNGSRFLKAFRRWVARRSGLPHALAVYDADGSHRVVARLRHECDAAAHWARLHDRMHAVDDTLVRAEWWIDGRVHRVLQCGVALVAVAPMESPEREEAE